MHKMIFSLLIFSSTAIAGAAGPYATSIRTTELQQRISLNREYAYSTQFAYIRYFSSCTVRRNYYEVRTGVAYGSSGEAITASAQAGIPMGGLRLHRYFMSGGFLSGGFEYFFSGKESSINPVISYKLISLRSRISWSLAVDYAYRFTAGSFSRASSAGATLGIGINWARKRKNK